MASRRMEKPLASAPGRTPPQTASYLEPRPRKVAIACTACQKRKSRCIGGVPCDACRNANTQCAIDEGSDGRRKTSVKRKIDALEQNQDLLFRLVDTLRDEDDQSSRGVLNLIRSNASLDEIRLCLAQNEHSDVPGHDEATAEQSKKPKSVHKPQSNPRLKFMDVKRMSDMPLFQVPASPWTSVITDDAVVSHLISLYFTWQHQVLNWIDRDLFLGGMKSGNLDSPFCSPLLVNSILAAACFYSDYPEAFASPDDPNSRGMHFYNEAERLLKNEEGRLSLTTLQALGDIYTSTCVVGKDRQGWNYLVQISETVREMMLRRPRIIAKAGERAEEMARAFDNAVFGLFNLTPIATLSLQKPALMKKPIDLDRFPQNHDPKDMWMPYPKQSEPAPAHTNCGINGLFDLMLIVWDVSNYFFGDQQPPKSDIPGQVSHFHQRMEEWTSNLPECIDFDHAPTPAIMDMHMRYDTTILIMFGFVKPDPDNDPASAGDDKIRELRFSSARRICTLLNRSRSQWPLEYMPMNAMQWSTVALFTLLEGLDDDQNTQPFVDLCVVLRSLARRWQLAKGMMRLVQLTAVKMAVTLPAETQNLFKDFEAELWKTDDRERFSSLYPNFATSIRQENGSDEVELDRFLEEWDDLTI
ncbi:uncharacterized protein N7459_004749 [Penicillium hispanicum]|uniref:uncharacterized protein n=1 Tax=Penicillium hispanicum TaxID=1080232 RepID=UPI0025425789|nr:uncharacterized protein N7459_004749 [Penicillium hispanicum]KAJ5584949.1 hypothetical protein N7459_004749 [Penicillium hispanicum]